MRNHSDNIYDKIVFGWNFAVPLVFDSDFFYQLKIHDDFSDVGEALRRLTVRLENSKYAEKILAYHICYGACGESMLWGRQSGRFGDYGIANQRHFYNWALKKYGNCENIKKAWGNFDCVVPPSYLREKATFSSEDFYKNETADRQSVDYDV